MPRQPRILLPQSYYHIMTRGNNKNQIFKQDSDYYYYLNLLDKYKKDLPFKLFHYCLMPTHIHLLVQIQKTNDFSLLMKKINLAYFHHFRQEYGWTGHFWQGRFKSQPVGKDDYFIQCGKYIELNPVRKKIVKKAEEYKFSSYKYYANGNKNKLITEDIFYPNLGQNEIQRQNNYKKMIIDKSTTETYHKSVWGSDYQRHQEIKKNKYNIRQK